VVSHLFLYIFFRETKVIYSMVRSRDNPSGHKDQNPNRGAFLPYIQGVIERIARVLNKKEIKTSFKSLETIKQSMRSVKDKLDPHNGKGIHKIECSCSKYYISETGHSFHVRIKEHRANIKNECIHTSTLAEHSLKTRHHVCLEDTKILAKKNHLFK
jgi:hypothetical protein